VSEPEYAYYDNADLEAMTGIPKATWRYWHSIGQGPPSMKIGRKRVYRKSAVHAWLDLLESVSA
jgi:prophage regulatory protein